MAGKANWTSKEWVDEKLGLLTRHMLDEFVNWSCFEPTPSFYAALASGEEDGLQVCASQISRHLGLTRIPKLSYEFALRMGRESAGEIRYRCGGLSKIRIPLDYVGKPMALGGILSHELTHELLFARGFPFPTAEEVEPLTDLTAFYLGLGKTMLNGIIADLSPDIPEVAMLGYLEPAIKVYAYRTVGASHGLDEVLLRHQLSANAIQLLNAHS